MRLRSAIIASALALLAFTSCQKEQPIYYIDECNCSMQTVVINVSKDQWSYSNLPNNNYFYATVDMPEITQSVFKTGIVKMYRLYGDISSSTSAQAEMPFTRYLERDWGDDYWEFYSESLDYEFSVGQMTIFYTLSNFDYEIDVTLIPDTMQFRCVVME